jgi:SAM-dependent methyltransferase
MPGSARPDDSSIASTRAFFGGRAAGWEDRFPDDGPAYAVAVAALELRAGQVALDAACGTGRALPPLRSAVGPAGAGGMVLGVDATPQMLAEAARLGRDGLAHLVLADVTCLPLGDASVDAVFAAGLISHLADPVAGLRELGRVARPGARLAVFHPIGRAALAARHGHSVAHDDVRGPDRIEGILARSGWRLDFLDDGPERYLALAARTVGPRSSNSS